MTITPFHYEQDFETFLLFNSAISMIQTKYCTNMIIFLKERN